MRRFVWFAAVVLTFCAMSTQVQAAGESKTAEASESAKVEMSPDEMVAALGAQCAESAEARAARHAEKSLFERLGGEKGIHAIISEVVRLHLVNEDIKHLLVGVDTEKLVHGVTMFLVSGTGGPAVYEGPTLTESHAHMKLTNADFLAAGRDVIQGMKNLDHGQNEIDEMLCAFVGLRDQVVLSESK